MVGLKRSFFNRQSHHYGVLNDFDEGEPFAEKLNFEDDIKPQTKPKPIEEPIIKSTGGYKRKPYKKL